MTSDVSKTTVWKTNADIFQPGKTPLPNGDLVGENLSAYANGGPEPVDVKLMEMTRIAHQSANYNFGLAQKVVELGSCIEKLKRDNTLLSQKVHELEDWKKGVLTDMRKLRETHKDMKKKIGVVDEAEVSKLPTYALAKDCTMSPKLEDKAPPGLAPPPGLALQVEDAGQLNDNKEQIKNEVVEKMPSPYGKAGEVERRKWRISHLKSKLRSQSSGRPVVSPPFNVWDMTDVKLMLYPGLQNSTENQGKKQAKDGYSKQLNDCTLEGELKLKVPVSPTQSQALVRYCVTVGKLQSDAPDWKEHDFARLSVSGSVKMSPDWMKEMDENGGLTIYVDICNTSHRSSEVELEKVTEADEIVPVGVQPTEDVSTGSELGK